MTSEGFELKGILGRKREEKGPPRRMKDEMDYPATSSDRRLNLGGLGQSITHRNYNRLCIRRLSELLSRGAGTCNCPTPSRIQSSIILSATNGASSIFYTVVIIPLQRTVFPEDLHLVPVWQVDKTSQEEIGHDLE
ncbi:unnamed protein product [Timema podura]|uniref:Uncharacterized protein n=1 Tax=Timema podura TaxID=61482 RepID=A0ABN7P114_TIMPD|nr:unnamed protein product [Timema podura]